MKKNVALIGKGKWGKVLLKKLKKISKVKFILNSKDNLNEYLKDRKIDWYVVATPDSTHYKIVKKILKSGFNVFCEKPLTLTFKESLKLKHKLKI